MNQSIVKNRKGYFRWETLYYLLRSFLKVYKSKNLILHTCGKIYVIIDQNRPCTILLVILSKILTIQTKVKERKPLIKSNSIIGCIFGSIQKLLKAWNSRFRDSPLQCKFNECNDDFLIKSLMCALSVELETKLMIVMMGVKVELFSCGMRCKWYWIYISVSCGHLKKEYNECLNIIV